MVECENLRVGREYLASVSWPPAFQKKEHDRCYCSRCYPSTCEDTLNVAGRIYVIPRRWTRFGVYVDEGFANHHNVWQTWVNCYHGTSIDKAKSIVEHRQLLLPDDVTMDGEKIEIREGHIPGENFFFTTPTIMYASLHYYASTYKFRSPHNSKLYAITVALQCKQKPDSFIVQAETVEAQKLQQRICPHIPNHELEWKTKQRSAIMPYALLLRVERCQENEDCGTFDPQLTTSAENMGTKSIPVAKDIPPISTAVKVPNSPMSAAIRIEDQEDRQNMTKKRIAILITLILLTFPPISALIIGHIYKTDCPIQPWIPQWMTIFGAVGAGSFGLLFCIVCITFKRCSDNTNVGVRINGCIVCLLLFAFLAWLIMGSMWLFPTKSKVQFSQPATENYCQENLYMITFGFILAQYALIGLSICLVGIGALCWKCRS